MKIKKKINKNEDKFLCFCSKITYRALEKELKSSANNNLDVICDKLNLAKQCAACLPNIEDTFFQVKGQKTKIKNIKFIKNTFSIKDKVKNFFDYLSGNILVAQQGHLPMLVSNKIKTWLIISNERPSIINNSISNYKIDIKIFNKRGELVNKISHMINLYKIFKICLNNYVPVANSSLDNYYVKLTRKPIHKAFRGSIRPHFFYQTDNSMSAVHTQDGAHKINTINIPISNNADNNLLFIINPYKKAAYIEPKLKNFSKGKFKKEQKEKHFLIPSKGSKLLEIKNKKNVYEKTLFQCKSSSKVKCYFIIADKKFNNISVDHI